MYNNNNYIHAYKEKRIFQIYKLIIYTLLMHLYSFLRIYHMIRKRFKLYEVYLCVRTYDMDILCCRVDSV